MRIRKKIILASGSPRRKQLLQDAGFSFEVQTLATDESFLNSMNVYEVAEMLAQRKVMALGIINQETVIIGADTVVIVDGEILNKPENALEAASMLKKLSHKTHEVVTGVAVRDGDKVNCFSDIAKVQFKPLSDDEIQYYIKNYQPFDKAGAYGVQDFIGMIGIEKIEGSYYSVMGLPIHKVYEILKPYIALN